MIKIITGNIFRSGMQTLTNPVNCVGVMGKGLALEFKEKFPNMFKDYVSRCKQGRVHVGEPYIYKQSPPWILLFPTKYHYRLPSKYSYIKNGLYYLQLNYKKWGISSLAMPALGCGLGGLKWDTIIWILHHYLIKLEIPIEIYKPF